MGRGVWPWRLGTTSCILPGDLLANARFLAPRVDDVELVLFESEGLAAIFQSLKQWPDWRTWLPNMP